MRVLLVAVNRCRVPFPVYPIALDYLVGVLREEHDVDTIDLAVADGPDALRERLGAFHPDIVGISIRNIDNTDVTGAQGFIEDIREAVQVTREHSSAKVILGGAGFSIFPDELMRRLGADFGIIGEGERLASLLRALEQGSSVGDIEGVAIPSQNKERPRPLEQIFCRAIPREDQASPYVRAGGMMNLQTKRGCPFDCIYCTYPAIEGRKLRLFSPEAVAQEAAALKSLGAKFLFITDSVFNAAPRHNLEVASALRRADVGLPWGAFFSPLRPEKGYYESLVKAGLTHVEFGTESVSAAILAKYRKPFDVDDVTYAHEAAKRAGIHVAHYMMLGGPGETRETVEETLRGCEGLAGAAIFFFCGVRIYPQTALYELAVGEGQVASDTDLLEPVFYCSKDIAVEEILTLVRERSETHPGWVVGSGGEQTSKIIARLHARGRCGPLWENMVR